MPSCCNILLKIPGEVKTVKVKGSQEAHEAIRPALLSADAAPPAGEGEAKSGKEDEAAAAAATAAGGAAAATAEERVVGGFLHPSDLPPDGLEPQQRALYELIYRRTLASAMAESEADFTTVSLGVGGVDLGATRDEVTAGVLYDSMYPWQYL